MLHHFNTKLPHAIGTYNPYMCSRVEDNSPIKHTLREELQFFNASPSFVQHNKTNAPVTHHILQTILRPMFDDDEFHHLQVNTFVHRLGTEGMYANVPGWHCDFLQPDYEEGKTTVEEDENVTHWMIILGDNAPTLQFIEQRDLEIDFEGSSWGEVSRLIDIRINKQHLTTSMYLLGEIVEAAGNELYRSVPSHTKCWRYFFRATQFPKGHKCRPTNGSPGRLRRLQMVYVDCRGGW